MTTVVLIGYLVVGIGVYVLTSDKVGALERTVESHQIGITLGQIRSAIFVGIAALWPVWLVLPRFDRKGPL